MPDEMAACQDTRQLHGAMIYDDGTSQVYICKRCERTWPCASYARALQVLQLLKAEEQGLV